MLQYITNTECGKSIEEQVRGVLRGGCKWIQIRMKDASDDEIRVVVGNIKEECFHADAFLILNDRVELAKELEVSGVHLGVEDMSPSQARIILGAGAVIGATANDMARIEALHAFDIDYFGIGPFAPTVTKKKLAPVLGLKGMEEICLRMEQEQIDIANVAVGGIRLEDVVPLMECGVNGIAVSGAIANAPDIAKATAEFLSVLKPFEK